MDGPKWTLKVLGCDGVPFDQTVVDLALGEVHRFSHIIDPRYRVFIIGVHHICCHSIAKISAHILNLWAVIIVVVILFGPRSTITQEVSLEDATEHRSHQRRFFLHDGLLRWVIVHHLSNFIVTTR